MLGNILKRHYRWQAVSGAYVHDLYLPTREPQTTCRTLGGCHDCWERHDGELRIVRRIRDNRGGGLNEPLSGP